MYSLAFNQFNNKGVVNDRFKAARSWAMANELDSAFYNLDKIIRKRLFIEYEELEKGNDFINLHSDKRWQPLIDTMNFHKAIKPIGNPLISSKISIKNNSKNYITLYLLGKKDTSKVFYFDIKPKKTVKLNSYIGSKWGLYRKSEKTLIVDFYVTRKKQKFDTSGELPYQN